MLMVAPTRSRWSIIVRWRSWRLTAPLLGWIRAYSTTVGYRAMVDLEMDGLRFGRSLVLTDSLLPRSLIRNYRCWACLRLEIPSDLLADTKSWRWAPRTTRFEATTHANNSPAMVAART